MHHPLFADLPNLSAHTNDSILSVCNKQCSKLRFEWVQAINSQTTAWGWQGASLTLAV